MQNFFKILLLLILVNLIVLPSYSQKKTSNKKATTKKSVAKKKAIANQKKSNKKSTKTTSKVATTSTSNENEGTKKDTSKPDVVVLYAAFKPTLRNAAKINFSAATPVIDTLKEALSYVVPAQNLFFSYQPVPIKPLALFVDSTYTWSNNGYAKVGYGGYSTPYIETGWSFGDGKNNVTSINAIHTSSKGNLPFQQFSKTNLDILGNYTNANNHEWMGKFNFNTTNQFLYGYQPTTLVFNKDILQQQFTNIAIDADYSRKTVNDFGISYKPSLGFNYFFDSKQANEFTAKLQVPVTKKFNDQLALKLNLLADITSYKSNLVNVSNNLFSLNTTVQYTANNFTLNAGILPTWNNSEVKLLPNFTAEAKINGEKFIAEAGWIGYFQKNTYQSLGSTNPWLAQPTNLFNTKISEQYAGIKGSVGNHLTYNGRVSFLSMNNMPLFVNDLGDGKTFLILPDSNLQALKIHGEIGYSIQEKFSFIAGINFFQFTKSNFDKPFGLLPLELTGSLKWKLLKDLHLKSNVFIWDGVNYRNKLLQSQKLSAAIDFNAGIEYSIMNKLNLWLQFNNLLNSRYQRWNQYEVLGLNVIAGVVYSFR